MSNRDARYKSMLFNYETTGLTDFRDGEIEPIVKTTYKTKLPCLRERPPPLKDLHAMTDWKEPNVPFNLMHKPKEIVQTNPRHIQEPYSQPVDDLQKEVQRTRPRLVMTPATYLDDYNDSARELLIKDLYTTTCARTVRDSGIGVGDNVRSPLSPVYAPANPITLEKLQTQYVPPEWRMDSASWDRRQLRTYCDPTKYFWLQRTPNCEICKETSEREANRKIMRMQQP